MHYAMLNLSPEDARTILGGNLSEDLSFRLNRFVTCTHPCGASLTGGTCRACDAQIVLTCKPPFVTQHARDRLRVHFATIGVSGALTMLANALEVPPEIASALLQRDMEHTRDRYFLPQERRGLLVVSAPNNGHDTGTIVTYLRFGAEQQAQVEALWPTTT